MELLLALDPFCKVCVLSCFPAEMRKCVPKARSSRSVTFCSSFIISGVCPNYLNELRAAQRRLKERGGTSWMKQSLCECDTDSWRLKFIDFETKFGSSS